MTGFPLWAIGLVAAAFAPFLARGIATTLRQRLALRTAEVRSRAKEMRAEVRDFAGDKNFSVGAREESGDLPPIEPDK